MLLLFSIISVVLALVFYSTSIYQEFREKKISIKILVFLWLGFAFDLTGTILMSFIAKGFSLSFHSIIGLTALALMGVKAVWSSANYRDGAGKRVSTAYTIISGLIWLSVFIAGFFVH